MSYATFSKATDRFSSANLTGVGSFEFVYESVLYTDNRAPLEGVLTCYVTKHQRVS